MNTRGIMIMDMKYGERLGSNTEIGFRSIKIQIRVN